MSYYPSPLIGLLDEPLRCTVSTDVLIVNVIEGYIGVRKDDTVDVLYVGSRATAEDGWLWVRRVWSGARDEGWLHMQYTDFSSQTLISPPAFAICPPSASLSLRVVSQTGSSSDAVCGLPRDLTDALKKVLDMLVAMAGAHFFVFRERFLGAEEATLTSCKNATSPFNALENAGDLVATTNCLETLGALFDVDVFPPDQHERLAERLCFNIVANAGLGPFFAMQFKCEDFFNTTATRDRELVAGTFEAFLGCLYRRNSIHLMKHILKFCAVINMCFIRSTNVLKWLCGGKSAWQECEKLGGGNISLSARCDDLIVGVEAVKFNEMIQTWMEHCCDDFARGSLVAPKTDETIRSTKVERLPGFPPKVRVVFVCHEWDCENQLTSPAMEDAHDCYAWARNQGWGKPPSSKSWGHARCKSCKWWK